MNSRFVYPSSISLVTVILALICSLAGVAEANPDLQEARRALDELDYVAAGTHLDRALRWGKNTPAQMREIARLSGEVAAALGHEDQAEQFFFQVLMLDPAAELPAGSSPKVTAPFARAKARMQASGGLAVRCQIDRARPSVDVHIDSDPAGLVAGALAIYRVPGGSTQMAEAHGKGLISVALPATPGLSLYCAVIDEHGNRLLELGSDDAPLGTLEAAPAPVSGGSGDDSARRDGPSQPFYSHYATFASLAVVGAGAGGYFAWQVRRDGRALDELNQTSSEHEFSEARAVEKRGRRHALLANISFAAAGTCAAITLVQFLRRPKRSDKRSDKRESERSARFAPTLMAHGAGVSLYASF